MAPATRRMVVAGALLAVTALVVVTGVAERLWARMAPRLAPWQRRLAAPAVERPEAERLRLLEEQVIALNAENVVLRQHLDEYRALTGEGRAPLSMVCRGRITLRTVRQGRRYCDLDVGALDGARRDLAAVVGWSLVGMVAGCDERRCLLQQMTDAEARVPAVLLDGAERVAEGVAAGTGARDELRLDHVEDVPGLEVRPGMTVVTAGLAARGQTDATCPPGLVIGTVTAASRASAQADQWKILVRPLRVAESVESVVLVTVKPPEATPTPAPAPAAPAK